MSCYHPLIFYLNGLTENGKPNYRLLRPLTKDDDIKQFLDYRSPDQVSDNILVPCGKCLGCRLDKARQWADRMLLELDHSKTAVFVTLTYDNIHVKDVDNILTLHLPDLQKFFKRLRKNPRFKDREIRYYASGEYGSKGTHRPHYHAIIFGISLSDFDDLVVRDVNELGQLYYSSDFFQSIWQNGFCGLSDISWKTFCYVSRYVMKKSYSADTFVYKGSNRSDFYYCRVPEFAVMSRKVGIGSYYLSEHSIDSSVISLYDGCEVRDINLPVKLYRKYKEMYPDKADSLFGDRKLYAQDKILTKLLETDLSYLELLEVEEANKYLRIKSLKERM